MSAGPMDETPVGNCQLPLLRYHERFPPFGVQLHICHTNHLPDSGLRHGVWTEQMEIREVDTTRVVLGA
jgi:hypothetical protein